VTVIRNDNTEKFWHFNKLLLYLCLDVCCKLSSSGGSFLLWLYTVTALSLPNSFSRMSRSDMLLHSTNTALLARFLSLLNPSFNAFGSTASFMSLFVSWGEVFRSVALMIIPTVGGWRLLDCATGWCPLSVRQGTKCR
jgi:hypothetical protein